jgi:hypothetical protein
MVVLHKNALVNLVFIALTCFMGCTENLAGAGSETTNGITGCVVNKDGTKARQVTIRLFPDDFDPCKNDTFNHQFTTKTDDSGKYKFENLEAGSYSLIARNHDYSLCARVTDIQVDTSGSPLELADCSLDSAGFLVIDFSATPESLSGYCFIPGTDIYSFADSNMVIKLDRIPAGFFDSVLFVSSIDSGRMVVCSSVSVEPGQRIIINNPGWKYSRKIGFNTSITGADITDNLFDVAVLLRLNGDNFNFSEANITGADLMFTTADNREIIHEIEKWDPLSAKAEIWLHIDTLIGNSKDQFIFMYWGSHLIPQRGTEERVFDTAAGFQGVWHLGEDEKDTVKDATANLYYGLSPDSAVPARVQGIIGNARSFDGISSFITMPNTAESKINFERNSQYTISAWVYIENPDDLSHVIVSKGNTQYFLWHTSIHLNSSLWEFADYRNESGWDLAVTEMSSGEWVFVAGVHDDTSHVLFINGERADTLIDYPFSAIRSGQSDLMIGRFAQVMASPIRDEGYCYFKGIIDEVQISSVARSAGWIRLSYRNQKEKDLLIYFP